MKITIVGTGYVGLVTGVGLAAVGHTVTCVDRDESKIRAIEEGRAPFYEPGLDELLAEQRASGRLLASTSLEDSLDGSAVSMATVSISPRSIPPRMSCRRRRSIASWRQSRIVSLTSG